jgi:hypothetical protein
MFFVLGVDMIILCILWGLVGLFTVVCYFVDDWYDGWSLYLWHFAASVFVIIFGPISFIYYIFLSNSRGGYMYYKMFKWAGNPIIKGRKSNKE